MPIYIDITVHFISN